MHYVMGNGVPKMWSEFGLTDDQINAEFDKVKAREDPMYTKLASFFEDPQKKGRIPMVSLGWSKSEMFRLTDYSIPFPGFANRLYKNRG